MANRENARKKDTDFYGQKLLLLIVAVVLGMILSGCGNPIDLYATCGYSSYSSNRNERACADASAVSCALDNYPQCETLSCVKYLNNDPFCSKPCTDNAECGEEGECKKLVAGSGKFYCVKKDLQFKITEEEESESKGPSTGN